MVTTAQTRMASAALEYIPDVLADTGQRTTASAAPRIGPLVGVDGSGRPLPSLLYGSVTHAKDAVGGGASPAVALRRGGLWLDTAVQTALSDTGRQGESLGMGVRPSVTGYVRMLEGASCARCVVLAGKRVKSAERFLRHPQCDCRHIPASESVAGDLTVDPARYFTDLSRAQQEATFGKAGAEAIRSGADMSQVVNARRGMAPAQPGGRALLTTTEGMARRGLARQSLGTGARRARLMPESIAAIATDHEDYLRLLALHGYL